MCLGQRGIPLTHTHTSRLWQWFYLCTTGHKVFLHHAISYSQGVFIMHSLLVFVVTLDSIVPVFVK